MNIRFMIWNSKKKQLEEKIVENDCKFKIKFEVESQLKKVRKRLNHFLKIGIILNANRPGKSISKYRQEIKSLSLYINFFFSKKF